MSIAMPPLPAVAEQHNPLRMGLRLQRTPAPCTVIIFGASGDLASRKLLPALWALNEAQQLPPGFSIVGVARSDGSHQQFREQLRDAIVDGAAIDRTMLDTFLQGVFYLRGAYDEADTYQRLDTLLGEIDHERGTVGNRVFYLAMPPSVFPTVIEQLGQSGLAKRQHTGDGWTRIVIEKPFGRDLLTAQELNRAVHSVFDEQQVYRIDHYLGKETVQNIFHFRFANAIWEPLWNRHYVDHIQITAAENLGVEGRGSYYEEAGAVRDMLANHLLQLLTLTAMEPPVSFEADAVRDEKVKVLHGVRPFDHDRVVRDVVRGQYDAGWIGGERVPAYHAEKGVDRQSQTETYIAAAFYIDTWRWQGVPFYVRTGKRLAKRVSEIAIQFRAAPNRLFGETAPNVLALRIQPDEGISLQFEAKVPGPATRHRAVTMEFRYGAAFATAPAEAYQRLLLDVMLGDGTLFARRDEVETAWTLVDPLLQAGATAQHTPSYPAGSWGPEAADQMLERDGRRWRRP